MGWRRGKESEVWLYDQQKVERFNSLDFIVYMHLHGVE